MKKLVSMFLIIATLSGLFTGVCLSVSAAKTNAFSEVTKKEYAKVYTLASTGKTIPYKDKNLTVRGSITYGKSSSAFIDNKVDELYLYAVGKNAKGVYWAKVSYPIGSKRAEAYIPLSKITSNNGMHKKTKSAGKFYCSYRKGVSTSSNYYVDAGDTVYLIATSGNSYQILYPVAGGKWRIGWCSKTNYERYCNITNKENNFGSEWEPKVGTTVAKIKNGSSYSKWYNSEGNISARGGYYGQCTWYALGRFYETTGIQLKTAPNAKNWLNANASDLRVSVVYGANKIAAQSIAVRTTGTYGHVMFIEYVTFDSNGTPQYVYFTECNTDSNGKYDVGYDCILKKMKYSAFVSEKKPAGYIKAR